MKWRLDKDVFVPNDVNDGICECVDDAVGIVMAVAVRAFPSPSLPLLTFVVVLWLASLRLECGSLPLVAFVAMLWLSSLWLECGSVPLVAFVAMLWLSSLWLGCGLSLIHI